MTTDQDQRLQDLSLTDRLILVDIKKTAQDEKIHCVAFPLETDVGYVVVSYRAGEFSEIIHDTELEYMACVRSFRLPDFITLCQLMIKERDLQAVDYVWVDAICMDPRNRQAALQHMATIYRQAQMIVAVPDLAKKPVRNYDMDDYDQTLYHVLHGSVDTVTKLEEEWMAAHEWTSAQQMNSDIEERNECVETMVDRLLGPLMDWAMRVWVIGECAMAAEKRKFKYWFLFLASDNLDDSLTFFEFDFDNPLVNLALPSAPFLDFAAAASNYEVTYLWNRMYKLFHTKMTMCLQPTLFLDKILNAKASSHDARIYSIFPTSKYSDRIDAALAWHPGTHVQLKLMLYDIMDNDDKIRLLYLSADGQSHGVLPTFATPTIVWSPPPRFAAPTSHVDLKCRLLPPEDGLYRLHLRPIQFYAGSMNNEQFMYEFKKQSHWERLGLDDLVTIDNVKITTLFKSKDPRYDDIEQDLYLVGSSERNRWIVFKEITTCNMLLTCQDDHPDGFYIY